MAEVTDILLVLPNLEAGGAERVTVNLANAWVTRGLSVELALLHGAGPLQALLDPQVRVRPLAAQRARDAIGPLTQHLKRTRPRAILAAMPPSTWIAAVSRVLAGSKARLVVAEHFDWSAPRGAPPDATSFGFKVQSHLACRLADARVAVSSGVADSIARIAGVPRASVEVVHNPVTPLPADGELDSQVLASWEKSGRKTLIAVGSLKPAKDYPTLLRAMAKIADRMDVSLLIVGEGGLRAELEALARELRLEDRLTMPGFLPNPQAYLRRADLMVLSSAAEGLPTVLIEALACGTPVVSTDCRSGPRDILCDGRLGALVPIRDPDALATAAISSLGTTHDREALIARSNDFSIDVAADRYLELLLPASDAGAPSMKHAA